MTHAAAGFRCSGALRRLAWAAFFLACCSMASSIAQEKRTTHDSRTPSYSEDIPEQPAPSNSDIHQTEDVSEKSVKNTPQKPQPETPAAAEDQNRPEAAPEPNPYSNLPSLDDLYRKIPSQRGALKRFGLDVFRNGTGNLEKLPMDLPAGPDYLLGTGDGISINIRGSVPRTITRAVDREGRVSLPEAGSVVVAGQTVTQSQELNQQSLGTQFSDV